MKKLKRAEKRSVLWTWTISYIIVLFIPLITVFVNYVTNMETIQQEIVRVNELTLNNIKDNIDYFLEMEKEIYRFSFSDNYLDELQEYETKDASFYSFSKKYRDKLSIYSGCQNVKMYYMYYRSDLNYVLTESTGDDAGRYYKRLKHYQKDFAEYEDWKAFLEKRYVRDFFVERNMIANQKEYLLYYANSIYNTPHGKSCILIGIPVEEIAKLTEYFSPHVYLTLNIDEQPAAVFSQGTFIEELPEMDDMKTLYLHKQSDEEEISYSLIIPETYLMRELQSTRNSFVVNILLTLTFGIAGSIFLLRRNYQPLQKLLMEVKGPEAKGNEFLEMSNEYRKLKKDTMDAKQIAAEQRKVLIGSWLLSMMKGRTTGLRSREIEEELQLNIKGNIALTGFRFPMYDKDNIQYDEMMFFVVDNIFSELMEGYQFYRVEDGMFLLYIFDLQQIPEEEWLHFVTEQAEFLCRMMEEKWQTSVSCVISSSEKKLGNIKFLYQKVMSAFEYQTITGMTSILHTGTTTLFRVKKNSDSMAAKVKEYVAEHYTDSNLNISSVADYLQKTPKYISKIYKDETGEGILDYINRYRILKAVELLNSGQYTVKEVMELTGYLNSNSFRRNFLKVTGRTPGEYLKTE